jgi:hypothetical protein
MRVLDLNLASRPFRNNTLLWAGYSLAFVMLAAFTAWNILTWREHIDKLTQLQDTVQSIESRIADLDDREGVAELGIKGYDLAALEVQAAKANEVIEWKAFSWTRLFNKMERIQPYDVRMTSVRPLFRGSERGSILKAVDGEERQSVAVAVEGTAKDFNAFWEMQNVLLSDAHFGQVDPERLNRSESREIIFQLSFLYFPDAEEQPAGDETPAAEEQSPAVDEAGQAADEEAVQAVAPEAAPPQPVAEEMVEQAAEEQAEEDSRGTRFAKAKRKAKGGRR